MKITIKTLQQHTFVVEVEQTETVATLKKRIEDAKGKDAYPTAGQKLIYAGKMLDDLKTLQEYEIDEKNFVVVMVSKTKAPTPVQQTTSAATDSPSVKPESQSEKESLEPASTSRSPSETVPTSEDSASPSQPQTTPQSSDIASAAASALLTGAQYEENVRSIVAMGFSEDDVKSALRASFNNPDRAVEYLTNGIPESLRPAQSRNSGGQPSETAAEAPAEVPAADTSNENPFEFLRNQPQFQQMCRVLRENPSYLPSFMQELRDSNPQLLAQISRNQSAFIELINSTSDVTEQVTESSALGGVAPSASGGGNTAPPAGTQYIQISAEDKAAVDRLKDLGFSEALVVQVYMACDKNETLAANILLEDEDRD